MYMYLFWLRPTTLVDMSPPLTCIIFAQSVCQSVTLSVCHTFVSTTPCKLLPEQELLSPYTCRK